VRSQYFTCKVLTANLVLALILHYFLVTLNRSGCAVLKGAHPDPNIITSLALHFFEFRQGFDFIEILMSGGLEDLRIKLITEGHKIS